MLGLVAGPVIAAIARLEFENGLRTGVLPGGCQYPCGGCTYPRINSAPTGRVRVGHKGGVVVKRTHVRPNSDSAEFHAWVVLNYSSYVVLEQNWPYPSLTRAIIWIPICKSWKRQAIIWILICKPCLDVRQIPLGIPTFLPMEGVHSQNQKTMSALHSFTESLFPFMIGTFTAHQSRFR